VRVRSTCAVGVLIAALAAGCAQAGAPGAPGGVVTDGCRFATSPPAMEVDGTPQPSNQEALGALAERIRPLVEEPYAEVFGYLSMEHATNRIVVYRKPSAELDALILDRFRADCVELRDVAYSAVETKALADRIADDAPYWRGKGIEIYTVGMNDDWSVMEVQVREADVDKATAELPKRYGATIPIVVMKGEPITLLTG